MKVTTTDDGDAILQEENFDLKIGKDLQVYIKRKKDKQFESLKKTVPKGLTMEEKQRLLIRMAEFIKQQTG